MISTRFVTALGMASALVVGSFAASGRTHAQQIPGGIEELLRAHRSLEQPVPSAKKIELPAGNRLELLQVVGNVYMIAGGPSNVVVQIGNEGVFVVDTAVADISDQVLQAIGVLSRGPINYIANTTGDPDHYGGNERIGKAGENPTIPGSNLAGPNSGEQPAGGGNNPAQLRPAGAIVFGHENMLNRLSAPTGQTAAAPFALWPTSTFFTPIKTIWYNDEPIELRHQPAAHTDGDIMVFFRRSDVIAAGDVINTRGYPMIDLKRGGSIQGLLDALNTIIEITVPRHNQQGGTRVVPGHGRILNEADVVESRDMNTIIRDRVKLAIDKGMTLEQLRAQQPTLDYDGLYSKPGWTGDMYVEAIYNDLRRATSTAGR